MYHKKTELHSPLEVVIAIVVMCVVGMISLENIRLLVAFSVAIILIFLVAGPIKRLLDKHLTPPSR